jgi:hypothetical protein
MNVQLFFAQFFTVVMLLMFASSIVATGCMLAGYGS